MTPTGGGQNLDDSRFVAPDTFVAVEPGWWAANFGGMLLFGAVAMASRSRVLRVGFELAVATHVAEAVYAYDRARRAGYHTSAGRWALQTLAVGFPSLRALGGAIAATTVTDAPLDPSPRSRAPATS